MFLIAKLHPRLEETEQADYDGLWLNREASKTIIKRFYATKQELPLCIDHRGGSQTGYVKGEDRVGRVSDLFLNKEGELMVKCELFNHHQQGYKEVNQGIFRNKERWGVSVGLVNVNDPVTGKKRSSNLVHVALTNDPAFGAQGTYLTEWALSEEGIDKILSTKYADAEFSPQLSAKLEAQRRMDPQTPQQQQHQESATTSSSMEVENTKAASTGVFEEQQQQQQQQQQQASNKPLTTIQKREELMRMLNHCKTSECNLQDMDLAFRKRYNALEEEVGQEEEEQNSFLRKICVERNIPPANADIMFKILASTDAETLPLRQTMVHFAAATTAHQKLSEERFEQEKAQLMQERDLLKKRVDEETRNVHNKRSHPMASPYNYNTVTTTTVKKETTIPQQAQPLHRPSSATAAAATNAAPNSFNYLGDVTVHGTMPLNNEKINNLIKVDQSNPYERRNNYQTNSQKLWSVSQQFHQICNTGSVVKLPTF